MDQERYELEVRYVKTHEAISELSERQRNVLAGVCTGRPTKRIARDLGVSQRLIELERSRLLEVFEVATATEIASRMGEYRALRAFGVIQFPKTRSESTCPPSLAASPSFETTHLASSRQ